jgi:hypothetical protein
MAPYSTTTALAPAATPRASAGGEQAVWAGVPGQPDHGRDLGQARRGNRGERVFRVPGTGTRPMAPVRRTSRDLCSRMDWASSSAVCSEPMGSMSAASSRGESSMAESVFQARARVHAGVQALAQAQGMVGHVKTGSVQGLRVRGRKLAGVGHEPGVGQRRHPPGDAREVAQVVELRGAQGDETDLGDVVAPHQLHDLVLVQPPGVGDEPPFLAQGQNEQLMGQGTRSMPMPSQTSPAAAPVARGLVGAAHEVRGSGERDQRTAGARCPRRTGCRPDGPGR